MTFDYVIVGAGSAGCVLANRLSADPANQVVLIEAGGRDNYSLLKIPAAYPKLHRSKVDWQFWSEPQEALMGRRIYLPRGKVLGGCSSTNAMAYVRGQHQDYDDWAAAGNQGWSYREVLPYFKRSEHNENFANEYHGREGELNVKFLEEKSTPYAEAFLRACVECGLPPNQDYNGATQFGASDLQFTIRKGERHSAATAFLLPIMNRQNLKVLTHTQVHRILLDTEGATGVMASTKGRPPAAIKARKEVILSAGSFASPQLLLLSGIGEKAALSAHGIDCFHELPGVGKNLQDHLFVPVSALSRDRKGKNSQVKPWRQLLGMLDFYTRRRGILTEGPLEAVAFGKTPLSPDRVDYQFQFTSFQVGDNENTDFHDLSTLPREDGFTILPTLLRPRSRGELRLSNNDPTAAPIIQPRFFSDAHDRDTMIAAVKKAIDVLEADAFAAHRDRLVNPSMRNDQEAIWEHIQRWVETVYHPVGTCKMGKDELSVVDEELKVHGVERLRIVDGSIMPSLVSGNTNAPIYMIAEKAADLIRRN